MGLAPVSDVRSHIFTDQPWLAADPTLAPWPDPADPTVFQTGAWILPDERPLSPELETFLETGEPPVYFGFGSMRAPQDLSQVMIHTARALGRRAIVSRGWADLSLVDDEPDCLAIGEVNQQALFKRVAAVVHHGGAGTTTTAALAGAPASRHPPDVRPALLGTTNPRPRHRNRARTRHTNHRIADGRSRAHPPTRCGCPCPIHRLCSAPRRRTRRRPALDKRRPLTLVMTNSSGDVHEFGLCRLDTGQRVLTRENQRVPSRPKCSTLLLLLVRSPGKAFSKQELMAAVWPDSYVPSSEHRETGGNQSGVVP